MKIDNVSLKKDLNFNLIGQALTIFLELQVSVTFFSDIQIPSSKNIFCLESLELPRYQIYKLFHLSHFSNVNGAGSFMDQSFCPKNSLDWYTSQKISRQFSQILSSYATTKQKSVFFYN